MPARGDDHGIGSEPHFGADGPEPGGHADEPHLRPSADAAPGDPDDDVAAEPGHAAPGAPGPFLARFAAVSAGRRAAIAAAAAIAGGPMAILTALLGAAEHSASALLNVVVVGPVLEELAKNLPALWLCERSPWLLPGRAGIVVAALGAGLGFAVIENLLYLEVHVAEPTPALVQWRWTVCVALHMGCAAIGSLGIARARAEAALGGRRGRIETMVPPLAAAAGVHGAYNLMAVSFEAVTPF